MNSIIELSPEVAAIMLQDADKYVLTNVETGDRYSFSFENFSTAILDGVEVFKISCVVAILPLGAPDGT